MDYFKTSAPWARSRDLFSKNTFLPVRSWAYFTKMWNSVTFLPTIFFPGGKRDGDIGKEARKGKCLKTCACMRVHTHTHTYIRSNSHTHSYTQILSNSGLEENRKYHLTLIFLLQPDRKLSTFLRKIKVNVFGNCLTQGPNSRWISHYFIGPGGNETSDLLSDFIGGHQDLPLCENNVTLYRYFK